MKKKIHLILVTFFFIIAANAQGPQGILYEAAARNANGNILANTPISIRFSIHDSAANGNIAYQEIHNTTTNSTGMFRVNIGFGNPVFGSLNSINWANYYEFMQVELDIAGGSNYVNMGTQQIMSVPYALFATKSTSVNIPAGGTEGQILTTCNGNLIWTNGGQCPDINSLNCDSAINNGAFIYYGINATGLISVVIPYSGGNGNPYCGQSISSTGVTGLTATLSSGNFETNLGSISWDISGMPSDSGVANFAVNFGGLKCSFHLNILASYPSIGSIFLGGVIGYIYQPGDIGYIAGQTHGIIVAPIDQSVGSSYGCSGTHIVTSSSIGTGLSNTNNILASCSDPGIAARLCHDFILNSYNGWYLPSKNELVQLFNNKTLLNTALQSIGGVPFSPLLYISSTEYEYINTHAYYCDFNSGAVNHSQKNNNYYVRAIRKF
jgi:hypothetical protein